MKDKAEFKHPSRTIFLPPKVWKIVEEIASRTGSSRSAVIRIAILDYAKALGILQEFIHKSES